MKTGSRLAFAVALLAGTLSAQASSPTTMTWTIEGQTREALVFGPSNRTAAKVPLVFVFHGHGGNMSGAAHSMRFQEAWPEALVVYPQGLPTKTAVDPRGRRPGWQREAGEDGDRDLKLVDAILDTLREKYPVDESRIYATGFSNGGFFSYLLWAKRGTVFAAFGVCAGLVSPGLPPAEPRPVIHIGGESDRVCLFSKQKETIQTILKWNGCVEPPEPCGQGCTRYASSKHTPVVVVVHPGGHVFPPWAAGRIVTFFRLHPAPVR